MCTPWDPHKTVTEFSLKLDFIHKSVDYSHNPWIMGGAMHYGAGL